MTVTGEGQTLTVPLLWAFGRGKAGQTYVFERNGAFYESRVSFYQALDGLDLTMGAVGGRISSIDDAAGRRMDSIGARDCFGCHSTGGVTQARLHLEIDDARGAVRGVPRGRGEARRGGTGRERRGRETAPTRRI